VLAAVCAFAFALSVAAPASAETFGIATVAGSGIGGFAGDGGSATAAQLNVPYAVAALPAGGFLVADAGNHRVRRVLPDGSITTVVGTGVAGNSGDGGPASAAQINIPRGFGLLPDGGFLLADRDSHVIRRVFADGTITTVAGTGVAGFSGDGGPATSAQLNLPYGAAPLPDGGFLIADRGNHAIRRVAADGRISTVAGTPPAGGFGGDGGPATAAALNAPCAVAVAPDGGFWFPDRDNNRVRRVAPDGTIVTVAGTGVRASGGDGGPAAAAALAGPYAVAAQPDGSLLVAERDGHRIRKVALDGTVSTLAGTGAGGFAGDGGPAAAALLNAPHGLSVAADGSILVADLGNNRVRRLFPATFPTAPAPPAAMAAPTPPAATGAVPRLRLRVAGVRVGRRAVRITIVASRATTLRLRIVRGRRVVVRARVTTSAGRRTVRIRPPSPSG
jgi:hypothetical protein